MRSARTAVLSCLLICAIAAGESPVPASQVVGFRTDAPGMVVHDPGTLITCTATLRNTGTAPMELAGMAWQAVRMRAMPHKADPRAVWAVDLRQVALVAEGRLAAGIPPIAPKATGSADITCRPGMYGQCTIRLQVGGIWQDVGGFAVVPPQPADRTQVPWLAGGPHGFDRRRDFTWMDTLVRLGVGRVRVNFAARSGADGALDWSDADAAAAAFRAAGLTVVMDFETPPGCREPKLGGQPVWYNKNKANRIPRREDLPAFESYATAFLDRYKDVVRGVFCRNEPWEGGSISNYHASNRYYRDWHAALFRAAQSVDPGIAVLANDQITNFEDVFQPDPAALATVTHTSHHVGFYDNRGAVQSAVLGLPAWETEDWSSHSDSYAVANLARKLAGGYATSNPIESCFLTAGKGGPRYPSPTAQALSTFVAMTAGMRFAREPWTNHLPHVIAFTGAEDAHRVVVFGRIRAYGYAYAEDDGDQAWPQAKADGVWRLADAARSLDARDIAGNPLPRAADGSITIRLDEEPVYLASGLGLDDLLARLGEARSAYAGPTLSLGLLDFTKRVAEAPPLRARVRNLRNHADTVRIAASGPEGWTLTPPEPFLLGPGEERIVEVRISGATERPANAYPMEIRAITSDGELVVREEIHVCVIPRARRKADGAIDWDATALPVLLTGGMVRPDGFETYAFPFRDLQAADERATFARFALAWDESALHIMAEVNDATVNCRPSESRGIHHLMHEAPLDYLYWRKPPFRGTVGDALKVAIDVFRPGGKHDPWLPPEAQRRVDARYQRLSADYEYDIYPGAAQELVEPYATVRDRHLAALAAAKDPAAMRTPGAEVRQVGEPIPEIWRLMSPGVRRGNGYPFVPTVELAQGLVAGAGVGIARHGTTWRYEIAIPWQELSEVKPLAGRDVRLSWYVINDGRRALSWTAGRSVCRGARQILHPTWQAAEAIETVWGFE